MQPRAINAALVQCSPVQLIQPRAINYATPVQLMQPRAMQPVQCNTAPCNTATMQRSPILSSQ